MLCYLKMCKDFILKSTSSTSQLLFYYYDSLRLKDTIKHFREVKKYIYLI